MSLLTIAENVSMSIGMTKPTQITTSTDREHAELLRYITETCIEMTRRVQWGDLTASTVLTGDGTAKIHTLPAAFDRLVSGVCATGDAGIIRPLTQQEWASLTPVQGDPRYFLLRDDTIQFYPYLASGETVTITYQSGYFVGGTAKTFTADSQSPIFDERTVELGTIARWKRQKGQSYQDHEAEYEAMLSQQASADDRGRF